MKTILSCLARCRRIEHCCTAVVDRTLHLERSHRRFALEEESRRFALEETKGLVAVHDSPIQKDPSAIATAINEKDQGHLTCEFLQCTFPPVLTLLIS